MAGDDEVDKSSVKNCKYCIKSVVSTTAKCVNCESVFHTSCALRVAGLVAVGKNNLVKCCRNEVEVMKSDSKMQELVEAKNEVLRSKEMVISELKSKEALLYKNINLLEEKIESFNKEKRLLSKTGNSGKTDETAVLTYAGKAQAQQQNQANQASNLKLLSTNTNLPNYDKTLKHKNKADHHTQGQVQSSVISARDVNAAVMQARQRNLMEEIQHLEVKDKENEWLPVGPRNNRRRRFVIGRGVDSTNIKTIPKYRSLHVTRLAPNTKPEDLKNNLVDKFPEVTCEEIASKHPEIYASMKVTINQDNFKKAWNREVWPNGAVISQFFTKRRVSLEK